MSMHRVRHLIGRASAGLLAAAPLAAAAHEGHGLPGSAHWHASDTLGWLLLAGVVAGLVWFGRRK